MQKDKNKLQIRNSTAEFLIFTRQAGEDGIEVRVADETVWLTQKLMAALFEVTVPTINEHLANLYLQGEIEKGSTIRNFRTVQKEGKEPPKRPSPLRKPPPIRLHPARRGVEGDAIG